MNNLLSPKEAAAPPHLFVHYPHNKADQNFEEWIGTTQGKAIYHYFKHFTFRLARVGIKRYSARAICQRIRWHIEVDRNQPPEAYKVNNNYTPYLARKFMEENPQFEGFFELRELKSK